MSAPALLEPFLAALAPGRRAGCAQAEGLAEALEQALRAGQRARPEIDLPASRFAAYLAERLPAGPEPVQALRQLHVDDLFLACAAAAGDALAQRELRDAHAEALRADLLRAGLPAAEIDDLLQGLFDRLLVASPERAARLPQYAGRGPLRAWLRVAAKREALNHLARRPREVAWPQDDLEGLLGALSQLDPELTHCQRECRQEFKEAFGEAFTALSVRERNLLRHLVLDRLSLEQIGRLYRVHQSTVSRWMAKLQRTLLRRTLRALGERLQLSRAEAHSLVRQIQSHLEVSLPRLLAGPRTEPDA